MFEGITRRQVSGLDLTAHSVAVLVPSLTALGSGLAFPSMIGPGFWVSTLLGFAIVGLFVQVFNQFATRFKSAGGPYTFVAKGLGPFPALVVAGGLVIGYSGMIGFGLSDAAGRTDAAMSSAGIGVLGGSGRELVLLGIGAVMCLYAISRGIQWSTRAALLAEIVSFVMLGVVLWTWTARYGFPSAAVFSLDGASFTRILMGAGFIVVLTLAFESSASLGLESKRPFIEVPFALRSGLGLAAVLFGLANVVAAARPADAPSVWTWRWFAPGEDHSVVDAMVLLVLAWSLVALALCMWCALARLLFSLAREGVLPAALGRVNSRGIPMVAALAVTPIAVLPSITAVLAGEGVGAFSWELKEATGVVMCTVYALTAVSLISFLKVIDEVSPIPVIAAVLAGAAAAAVAVNELMTEIHRGAYLGIGMLVVSTAVGLMLRWRINRGADRGDGRYVGMHDEALASAVRLPPDGRDFERAEV